MLGAHDLLKEVRVKEDINAASSIGMKHEDADHSFLQSKQLQYVQKQFREKISDEKVDRLGSMCVAELDVNDNSVTVIKVKGRVMSHYGYHDDGKFLLHPEEALFLMDVGTLRVLYGSIPLSMQEAHFYFFRDSAVTLDHYLVYSYLNRLGYIVRRTSDMPEETEIELSKQKRAKKRKDPTDKEEGKVTKIQHGHPEMMQTDSVTSLSSTCDRVEGVILTDNDQNFDVTICGLLASRVDQPCEFELPSEGKDQIHSAQHPSDETDFDALAEDNNTKAVECLEHKQSLDCDLVNLPFKPDQQLATISSDSDAEMHETNDDTSYETKRITGKSRQWYDVDEYLKKVASNSKMNISSSCKNIDYSKSDYSKFAFPPEGGMELKKSSPQLTVSAECQESEDIQHHQYKSHHHFNTHSMVGYRHTKKTSAAKNWSEFLNDYSKTVSILEEEFCDEDEQCLVRKFDHMASVLSQLTLSNSVTLAELGTHRESPEDRLMYDVFLPSPNFRKTEPGKPHHRILVIRPDEEPPSLQAISRLRSSSENIPIYWAICDGGDISFYSYTQEWVNNDLYDSGRQSRRKKKTNNPP